MGNLYTLSDKKSGRPVVTWHKAFFATLLGARPESISLTLAKLFADLARLGLPNARVQYDQLVLLEKRLGMDDKGMWKSKYSGIGYDHFRIQRCFTDGLMAMDMPMPDEVLRIVEAFYTMLDAQIALNNPLDPACLP